MHSDWVADAVIYTYAGLILLPYLARKGLDTNADNPYMPNTDPDWLIVAPLSFASKGKNGGSNVVLIPYALMTNATIITIIMDLNLDITGWHSIFNGMERLAFIFSTSFYLFSKSTSSM